MKLKGISSFEQHAEKFVAGLFGLALLAVLALQFLGKPSLVKVGTEEVTPSRAYETIAANAKRVDDNIKRPPADLPENGGIVTQGFANFNEKMTAPIAPHTEIAALDKASGLPGLNKDGQAAANAPINEIKVPAPTHALAAINMSTVSPSEQQSADVAKVLPDKAPFDKASVTVEAMFDGTALKTVLAEDPDGPTGPARAVPANWYSTGVQIIGVELHRQTLNADGTWSEPEKVRQMPGRPLYVDNADKLNDAASLKDASKFAADQSELIRRTPYFNAMFGEKWTPPSDRDKLLDADADKASIIRKKNQELNAEERAKKAAEDQLTKVGQPIAPTPGQGGGGAGGGKGHGASPPPPGPSSTPAGPSNADEGRKKQLRAAIDKHQEKINTLKTALRELGAPVEGDTAPVVMADPTAKPKQEPAVLENAAIKVWAHDVFVERGKTYRYQVGLILTNPYFGHSAAMLPAQADKLAKAGILRSAGSEWTDPILVDPETYIFFTSATEDEPSSNRTATARAEIFKFKWGFWRKGATTLEPGDSVIADVKVPDFTKLLAAAPAADPNQPQPAAPSPQIPSGKGGKGATTSASGIGSPPPSTTDTTNTLVSNTPPPMVSVPVEDKQIMIGVGQGTVRDAAGKTKSAQQVYMREPDGEIRIVIPDDQKSDAAYSRVSRSADRGQKELTPAADKAKSPITLPNSNNPSAPDARPARPSGG